MVRWGLIPGKLSGVTFLLTTQFLIMKKLLFLLWLLCAASWGHGQVRLVTVNTNSEQVTLKNFGTATEDISGYQFCLGPGQYNALGDYSVLDGNLTLDAEESVTITVTSGSGGVTALPDANGALALFNKGGAFGSNSPDDLVDYVQWGAANQSRVGQAVEAGRWDNADNFIAGQTPYNFVGGADAVGASFWVDDTAIRLLQVTPEADEVVLKNFDNVERDLSNYFFCTLAGIYPQLGNPNEVEILEGDLVLAPDEEVRVRVLTSGGVVDGEGSIFLFASNVLGFNNQNPFVTRDFAQWGAPNGFRVENAVAAGRWDAAESFIPGSEPFDYIGGAADIGAAFWEGGAAGEAIVRIAFVDVETNYVTLQNFGDASQDISSFWLCKRPAYDQIGNASSVAIVTEGADLILDPNESIVLDISPDGQSGGFNPITDLDENAEMALFTEANFGSTDPEILLDFVSWGGVTEPTRAGQAVTAGRWDAADSFVDGVSPFTYIGGAADVGAAFWEGGAAGEAIVRIVFVDVETNYVTLQNFGDASQDISSFWLCKRPAYDQIGNASSVAIVTEGADLILDPNESIVLDISPDGQSGGFNPITDLDENAEMALFTEANFGSTDPEILLDFVSWGGVTEPTRAGQAVTAGRWDAADSFVDGVSPFTYIGGAADVGAAFWEGSVEGALVEAFQVNGRSNAAIIVENLQEGAVIDISETGNVAVNIQALTNPAVVRRVRLELDGPLRRTAVERVNPYFIFGDNPNNGENNARELPVGSYTIKATPFTAEGEGASLTVNFEVADPIIRLLSLDTEGETVTLKNFGPVEEDISAYQFCLGPGQYNVLSDYADLIGDLNLSPGEEVTIDLTSGTLNVPALPEVGALALFNKGGAFGSDNPLDLEDFVQWGASNQARVDQAVRADRWDSADRFIVGDTPFNYVGGANDVGASFWEATIDEDPVIRLLSLDTDGERVTLKNFGKVTESISDYQFCLGPGQYNVLSDYAELIGDLNLSPGEEVTIDLTSGTLNVPALPEVGALALFNKGGAFGSDSPDDLEDYVQWGAPNQARVDQAVRAGRWDSADEFVGGASPFNYIGGVNDVGASFWLGTFDEDQVVVFRLTGQNNDDILIANLEDGAVLNLDELGNLRLNIQALTQPEEVGSVRFELDGPIQLRRTENLFPYFLFGDTPGNNRNFARRLEVGNYTLKATPFSENRARGDRGIARTISFSVVKGQSASLQAVSSGSALQFEVPVSMRIFPNPARDQATLQLEGFAEGEFNMEIFDQTGRRVQSMVIQKQGSISVNTLDLQGLPGGFYTIRAVNGTDSITGRLLIEK